MSLIIRMLLYCCFIIILMGNSAHSCLIITLQLRMKEVMNLPLVKARAKLASDEDLLFLIDDVFMFKT